MKKKLIVLMITVVMIIIGTVPVLAAQEPVTTGEQRAGAIKLEYTEIDMKDFNGTAMVKIPSNAHKFDAEGMVFEWVAKQNGDGYLVVPEEVFHIYSSFKIFVKCSNSYKYITITEPGTFLIEKFEANGKIHNINMVWIGDFINKMSVQNTYFVSQSSGDDRNPGTLDKPWKTLSKVSSMTFKGGDTILLKRGDTWEGETLYLKASEATHENWATVSSYGDPDAEKPKIYPGNDMKWSVKMENIDDNDYNCGWKIMNLEVAYAKVGIAAIDYRTNPFIQPNSLYGLWIENCYIHDITGLNENEDYYAPYSAAIQTNAAGQRCRDYVTIKDIIIEDCDMGISLKWVWNFLIDNVTTNYMSMSGIDLTTAINGVIQNSRILNSGQKGYRLGTCAVGFMHTVVDVVMKNCEIAYTLSPDCVDGCAVDFEGASSNVTVQDCFIHDNAGRAFLIMATGGDCENSNILNNVCVNNGWDSDIEVEPAFLLVFGNNNNGGTIAGNTITKAYWGQALNRIEHTYTEGYPSGFHCYDNTVIEADPPEPPIGIAHAWNFDNDGDTEGWYAYDVDNIINLYAAGGYLNGTTTGIDPFMRSGDNLGINIDNVDTITIRMKNSTSSGYGQIFFITDADSIWGGEKVKFFPINPNDSAYTEYTINMNDVAGWEGTLRQLRLDPSNDDPNHGSFSIDSITLNYASTEPDYIGWEFNTDGDTEGWYAYDVDDIMNLHASGGCLNGTITGIDPFMRSGYDLNIPLSGIKTVTIKMKNSSAGPFGEIYFITNEDGNWGGAEKSISFSINPNDPEYTVYTIDMSDVSGWNGTLKQLRIDPGNWADSGSFSIDYIRLSQ